MTIVQKYVELPGVWWTDEAALEHIGREYGRTYWQALCDIRYRDSNGAVLELDSTLGDLYFDDELQTFLFTVRRMVEESFEEEFRTEGENGEEVIVTAEELREVGIDQLRAVSFLPEEGDGAR